MMIGLIKKIVAIATLASVGAWATPVSEHGQLSISGFDVVDKNGNPYILRGMSMFWDIWGFDRFYNSGVVSTLAGTSGTGWGANLVRAAIADFNVNLAKNMIDYTNNSGIYIIIDNHSHCAHKDVSSATNFFSQVSQYVSQKGYKHVMYEVFNEPLYENCNGATDTQSGGQKISWTTIKNYAKTVIATIRNNDKNGIIFVGTPNYSAGTEAARADPITGYSNIAYSLHFYASSPGHASYRYNLLRGKCNDFPIFITEWGTSESDGNGSFNRDMNDTWLSWVETVGVGWANWSISDKGETSSALTSGAGTSGNWSDGQISQSGKYVRNLMKTLNAGGSLESVGLSKSNIDCKILDGASTYEFVRTGIGTFGYMIEAENYLDSNNAKTVDYEKASNKRVSQSVSVGQESSLTYALEEAPYEKGYYRFQVRLAADHDGYFTYSINGKYKDSVEYKSTGGLTSFEIKKSLIIVPRNEGAVLTVSWNGNVAVDYVFVGGLGSSDSVAFGLLEIGENGERTVLIPEEFSQEDEEPSIIRKKEIPSSRISVHLSGKNLELNGVNSAVSLNVLDVQGRVLMKRQLVQSSGMVDLSALRPGVYVVRLKGSGISETKKIQLR